MDGFVNGLPGVGRNSYSYCVYDGRIVLEDDFGMSTVPECTSGDVGMIAYMSNEEIKQRLTTFFSWIRH